MQGNDRIAYCGLYCPLCSIVTAFETQDRQHLLAMPERYERLKERPLEECDCKGCRDGDLCHCDMKPCAEAKGVLTCADCDEFPCEHINAFGHDGAPHHEEALRNLYRIRVAGYEQWLAEMQQLERCQCGARQSWYLPCQHNKEQNR